MGMMGIGYMYVALCADTKLKLYKNKLIKNVENHLFYQNYMDLLHLKRTIVISVAMLLKMYVL